MHLGRSLGLGMVAKPMGMVFFFFEGGFGPLWGLGPLNLDLGDENARCLIFLL